MDQIKDILFAWQKRKGLEALEIYAYEERGLKIEKKDCRLENFQPYEERGLAVRVLQDGALGFAFTTSFSPEDILGTALKAYEMASAMPKDDYTFPVPEDYPILPPVKESLISPEEGLDILQHMEEKAFSCDSRIKRIQEVGLSHRQGKIYLANTNGLEASWDYGAFSLVAVVIAMAGDEAQMGWEWQLFPLRERISPEEVVRKAVYRAVNRLGAKPLASQKIPVLLPPHVAVDFLELLSESFLGENLVKGKSILKDKMGQKVFPSFINIVDNGVLVDVIGTRPFDDEGIAQRETILVKEGRIENFLFDSYWGKKAGYSSTGNARRGSFKNQPSVGLTNFYLQPGEKTPEQLTNKLPQFFEVLEVLGMHTADSISGEFSLGVSGLLHHKGETIPVSGMAISGDIFSLFEKIEALGNDLTFYGNIGSPSILTAELDLAGS
ncbi:TldD/PmbA family protein [Thermodesulfatator autotrophicus]|uniref:TldD/PmbA family protein n=1 Tax=Thermodesulfatator autotrophicus TaxID=1795632 RepID=A0A177E8N8_9BACT|nr:TldD/PmbA family protein [Thermodesulfatator autotrophicus]OAG28275.1 hypothetical protein TH606_02685 [Thermodesulfatator autotrophicus]